MTHWLALLGALPACLAMFLADRADAKRPEPRWTLRRVAFAGAASVIPAAIVELLLVRVGPPDAVQAALYMAFAVAAPTEEACKALCIRWFVWNRPEFDERTDGIVYGARAGLGFALVENVMYLAGTKSFGMFLWMFCARAVLTVPMHAICGAMSGHRMAWRRFEKTGSGIFGGYAIAVLLHGTFDAGLFLAPLFLARGEYGPCALAGLCPLVVTFGGLFALRYAWRRAASADEAAFARAVPG